MLKYFVLLVGLATCIYSQTTPVSFPTVPSSEFDCSAVPDPDIDYFYPSPTDCNEFYRCTPNNTLAYRYHCANPFEVFNPATQYCDYPENVLPPCGTYGVATQDPNLFYCDNLPNGRYPDPNDCTKFYYCDNNSVDGVPAEVLTCPSGLHFNPATQLCDWPGSVPGC